MNDRHNIITSVGSTGLAIYSIVHDFISPIKYIIIATVLLVIMDLYFGISESRQNGKPIRKSRAFRRTANKLMDYFFFILLTGLLQQIFLDSHIQTPYFSLVATILIGFFELESIINHWLVLHHRKRIKLKNYLVIFSKNDKIKEVVKQYDKDQKEDERKEDKQ